MVRNWDPATVAAAGAAHLDEVFPGWEDRVVLTRLKMNVGAPVVFPEKPCGCIGAQLDAIWTADRGRWGRYTADWTRGYRRFRMRQIDHGLMVPDRIDDVPVSLRQGERLWGRLNGAWRREIRARRVARA